jgi:hypothetical protein
MKTLIVLFLSILPTLSIAQCSLDIPDGVLTSAPLSSLVSEFNPSSFARDDVTYLCYSRADSDNTTFDAIRISLLFTHGSTQYSIRLSYMCRSPNWRYDSSWAATLLSAADHIATNMTIEGCTSCADSSTESFGSPTGCTVASPCDSSPCSNGGTCDRTGLTTSSCSCAAPWGGPACSASCTCGCSGSFTTCTRTCQNGGTLDGASCTCGCSGSFTGDQCQNCPLSCQWRPVSKLSSLLSMHPVLVVVVEVSLETSVRIVPSPVKMEAHLSKWRYTEWCILYLWL